jgi:HSP20 family molecular chaperone IbpA
MRARVHAIALPSEIGDFPDEVRKVFAELGRVFGPESLAGECSPAVDVYETDESMEIVADLPGVDRAAIRVLSKGDSVLIAGEKPPRRVHGESSFHLVERGYGRFARAVRVGRPCDMAKATAIFADGELRISLPKLSDRRGRTIQVEVRAPADGRTQ